MIGVEKVDVVRKPANAEDRDDHREHLDDLPLVFPTLYRTVRDLSRSVSPEIFSWNLLLIMMILTKQ